MSMTPRPRPSKRLTGTLGSTTSSTTNPPWPRGGFPTSVRSWVWMRLRRAGNVFRGHQAPPTGPPVRRAGPRHIPRGGATGVQAARRRCRRGRLPGVDLRRPRRLTPIAASVSSASARGSSRSSCRHAGGARRRSARPPGVGRCRGEVAVQQVRWPVRRIVAQLVEARDRDARELGYLMDRRQGSIPWRGVGRGDFALETWGIELCSLLGWSVDERSVKVHSAGPRRGDGGLRWRSRVGVRLRAEAATAVRNGIYWQHRVEEPGTGAGLP